MSRYISTSAYGPGGSSVGRHSAVEIRVLRGKEVRLEAEAGNQV